MATSYSRNDDTDDQRSIGVANAAQPRLHTVRRSGYGPAAIAARLPAIFCLPPK
mgnify:CR=1 FL=1